jgi:hypothetical protein
LNGREKVVEKKGPFSPTFCQIVALMLLHRSVFAGCLPGIQELHRLSFELGSEPSTLAHVAPPPGHRAPF